jgi:PAS domain S-box-containing protein
MRSSDLDRRRQRPPTDSDKRLARDWRIFGLGLLPLLAATAVVLYILDIETTFQPPLLFPVLSTIFSTGSGLVIAFYAIRTYILTSTWRVLFLGGGALAWGISSLLAGWMPPASLNVAVTVSNFGVLLAATLHFLGAIQKPRKELGSSPTRKLSNGMITILFCSGIFAFFILIYVAASAGVFPAFFIPGEGYTLIRYIFSAIYLAFIVITAVVYARVYILFNTRFIYWYSLGLAIIALGLIAGFLDIPGSPLNWLGRIAQYAGSVYFVVAVLITRNEARNKQIGVAELIAQHLNRSRANYELLVEAAADAIIAVGGHGRILMWNPAAERMFGYSRSEAIGSPFLNMLSGVEDTASYQKISDGSGRENSAITMELTGRRRDGSEFRAELTLAAKKVSNGWLPANDILSATDTTVIIRDITERKRTEDALRESERSLAEAQRLAHIGSWEWEIKSDKVRWSDEMYEIFGVGRKTFDPDITSFSSFIHPDDRQSVADVQNRLATESGSASVDFRIIRPDGSIRFLHAEGKIGVFDNSGKPSLILGTDQDITERKKAEEALQRRQSELQGLFDFTTNASLVLFDGKPPYTVLAHNKYYQELWAEPFRTQGLVGKNIYDYVPGVEVQGVKTMYDEVVRTRKPVSLVNFPYEGLPQGKTWWNWHLSPILQDGQVVSLAHIGINVTEEVTARQKVEEQNRLLEEKNEVLRESEAKASALIKYAPTGIYEIDFRTGSFLSVNDAMSTLTGYTREELFALGPGALLDDESKKVFNERAKRQLAGEKVDPTVEYRVKRKDGSLMFVNLNVAFSKVNPSAVFVIGYDITERKKGEEALRESEERFRALNETSPIGVGVTSADGMLLYTNPSYQHILGYEQAELIGKRASELYWNPDDRRSWVSTMRDRGVARNVEVRLKKKDGKPVWVSINASPIVYGGKQAVMGTIQDITERMKAEEDIQNTLSRFYSVLTDMPLGILLVTSEGFVEFVNQTFCDMFNLKQSPASLKNRSSSEMIELIKNSYMYPERAIDRIAEIVGTLELVKDEEIPMRDRRTYLRDFVPLRSGEKNYGRLWVHRDITASKKAEEESERLGKQKSDALAELQTILDTAPVAIWIARDLECRTITGNVYANELFKVRRGDNISRSALPGERSISYKVLRNKIEVKTENLPAQVAAATGKPVTPWEMDLVFKDGRQLHMLIGAVPLFDADGQVRGSVAVGTNITEQKQAMSMKDDFIGMVSHEIRTPLTVLIGALGTAMTEGITPEDARSMLQTAMLGAESLDQIVNNLLELSRYQSDRLALHKEPIDIAAVIRNIADREQSRAGSHKMVLDVPEGLLQVQADKVRVELILQNILNNAVKYSPEGTEIRIVVRNMEKAVVVSVRDQGKGISLEDQVKLFTSFERLKETSTTKPGLGLGLLVCRRLVEAHGGKIWVESEPGKGSVFNFTLLSSSF